MRRTTIQKQKDDMLGFRREVRRTRLQRSGGLAFFGQQSGQSEHAETVSGAAQKFAASHFSLLSSQRETRWNSAAHAQTEPSGSHLLSQTRDRVSTRRAADRERTRADTPRGSSPRCP